MLAIHEVKAFSDNYIWVISDGTAACVVDPGDAEPVLEFLNGQDLNLVGILLTHWHGDHQGGVESLCATFPGISVIGSNKQLKGPSQPVSEDQHVDVLGASFRVIEVPGHTLDHVAYYSDSAMFETPVAFTGDTLFAAGCGRLFEGSPKQMFSSLQKLNQMAANTRIFCAHEYTLANLKYAVVAEPSNTHMSDRLCSVSNMRQKEQSTVPTTLEIERLTNPFLRARNAGELALRRSQKDSF